MTKEACFIKRTIEGYKNLLEILSWFIPDFSYEFGAKCVFGSMAGSVVPWIEWAPEVDKGALSSWVGIMLLITVFVVPVMAYPLYRAFGICYCGLKQEQRP
jgi:hypothetical protein